MLLNLAGSGVLSIIGAGNTTNSDKQADKYDDFTITVRDAGGNAKSLPISIKVRGGDYRDLPAPASKDDAPDDAPDDAKVLSSFEINSLREVPNVGGTTMAIIFYVMDYADANAALNILFPTDTNARPTDFTAETWGSRIPGFYLFNNAGIASNAPIDNPDTDLSGKDTAYIGNTLPDAEVMLSAAGDQDTYIIQAVFGTSDDTSSASVKIKDPLLGDTGKNIIYLEAGLMITAASVERPTNNITLTFSNGARLIIVNAEAYFVFQRGENDPLESATIFLSSIGYNALNDSLGNVPHTIVNNSVVTVEFAADAKFEYNGNDDDEEAISISIMVDGGGNIAARQVQFFAATDASGNGRVNIGDKSVETSLILKAAHVGKFIGADVSWTDIKDRKEMVTIYSPTVITDANAAVPEIDAVIGVNSGEGHVLTYRQLDASDDSTDPASLTYTISGGAGLLEMLDGTTWSTLSDGGTFTQADINADKVRILTTADGIFTFTVSDGTNASPAQTIQVKLRTPADLPPTTVPLEGVDIKAETDPKSVKTGVGETTIELGIGDDEVNPGAADDEVILDKQDGGYDGHDKVIYRFAETGGTESRLVAWDGGDLIKGFTPGEDAIQFGNRNTAADSIDSIDSIDAFLNKLNTDFKVMLDFERKQDASSSSTSLADYNVAAIKLQFAEAMLLPGGKLAGSIVVIEFKAPIAWTEFKKDWLDGDNQANFEAIFDIDTFSFKNTDAGKAALSDLLWLSFKADTTTRNVAIGGDQKDSIAIVDDSGGWVIFGGQGNDFITLFNGAEEVVYTLSDTGTSLTTSDGSDTINNFTLGTDSLRFVDDDGAVPTVDGLMSRMTSVALKYNGTSYTGVEITIDSGNTLTVNFAANRGTTDNIITNLLTGTSTPSAAGDVTLSLAGRDYIDDLFGGTDGIFVSDTIPTELL